MDPESEMKAREVFAAKGLSVVGWYHSHPYFEPNPSIRDIEYQTLYQQASNPTSSFMFVLSSSSHFLYRLCSETPQPGQNLS